MTVTGKIKYKVGPISFGDYVHAFFSSKCGWFAEDKKREKERREVEN